jgi:methylmalonyl-CoA mutase
MDSATVPSLSYRTRFVTAASLFDGHDAAINIIRRLLQSSGAEVVHLGHNRSVDEIVRAAVEEDAQAVAISSYQGGHVEFFRYMVDRMRDEGMGHVKIFGGGGGTITPKEALELENYGVEKIYSPEDGRKLGLQGMIDDMIQRAQHDPLSNVDAGKLDRFATDRRILAQALTCLELAHDGGVALPKDVACAVDRLKQTPAGPGFVIGMTGTGGAGKSSLTDELVLRFLEREPDSRIAILAVDPTRRKSGGALLGDRLRINTAGHDRVFMRSFATREANVSISRAARDAVALLRAAGYTWIFLETGGIGQADTSIVGLADAHVYVMTAEFGAPTQLEKINMLDYADVVVLNKVDKQGALDAITEVRKQLRRNHKEFLNEPLERLPVFGTMASRFADPGVTELAEHLASLRGASTRRKLLPVPDKKAPLRKTPHFTIVPRERIQYLAEIAQTVRRYHEATEKLAEAAERTEALERALGAVSWDEPTRRALETACEKAKEAEPAALRDLLAQWNAVAPQYDGDEYRYTVRGKEFRTELTTKSLSHLPIRKVVPPRYRGRGDLVRFLRREHLPGFFPFTAGVFPFKRTGEDPKRMFAGEGTPTRTNKRFHFLCDGEKAKRLSTAFDSVTLYGQDPSERPDIYGKIGESGVSVCTLDDMKKLYAGFDLCDPNTSVSMTINGPAPILLAFFFNTALDQAVEKFEKAHGRAPSETEREAIRREVFSTVRGTVQADILKEDQAQNTCIFSTDFALRMMGDIQQYFIENNVRNYYSVSISGYHIAEAGANPITQLAFTLANGFTYVEYYLSRGMSVDAFAPNLSFFFSNGLDPEYTVIGRVARRIWAIAMRDRYGASERSQKLKYHIQTSGRSLHAQEMAFNDIRTTLQALLAFFDNCNSLHTNAYDEALTTPTTESVRRAMAIQLILTKEFGWLKNENPHQGSFFVEELTALVEEAVLQEFERLSARGGVLGAMETQYQRSTIQEESLYYERLKHSGELPIVGVNTYLNPSGELVAAVAEDQLTRATPAEKQEQIANLREFQRRHAEAAGPALEKLKRAAVEGRNIFAELLDCARVASLGQMSQALYAVGGRYRRGI